MFIVWVLRFQVEIRELICVGSAVTGGRKFPYNCPTVGVSCQGVGEWILVYLKDPFNEVVDVNQLNYWNNL